MHIEESDLWSFVLTDKIFLKTPIATCMWLEAREFFEMFFDGSDEILHIFTHEDLENQCFSWFQKDLCDFENGKIELHGTILIDSGHASCGWSNI